MWHLSDSVYGAQPTRRPSLLPTVQKASARAQEVTSSHLNLGDVLRRVLCTGGPESENLNGVTTNERHLFVYIPVTY